MKVIAKFRTVEVTYANGEKASIKCKSLKDALEYSKRLINVIPFRERAVSDRTYLTDFYLYLKSRGYIEKDLYTREVRLFRKVELLRQISRNWAAQ